MKITVDISSKLEYLEIMTFAEAIPHLLRDEIIASTSRTMRIWFNLRGQLVCQLGVRLPLQFVPTRHDLEVSDWEVL